MEEARIKSQITKILKYMYDRELISICAGNVSARRDNEAAFWITPSGSFKPEVNTEELVKCDLKGHVIEGDFKASSETPMHSAIYRTRSNVNAIVHAHTPLSVGISLAGKKIKAITPEAAIMLEETEVPILPFRRSGTKALANQVSKYIENHNILILGNHGSISVGKDLQVAYSRIEVLEETATMMMIARVFGKKEFTIPEKIKERRKSN